MAVPVHRGARVSRPRRTHNDRPETKRPRLTVTVVGDTAAAREELARCWERQLGREHPSVRWDVRDRGELGIAPVSASGEVGGAGASLEGDDGTVAPDSDEVKPPRE